MPSREWSNFANRGPYIGNVAVERYVSSWGVSPRGPNGKLRLIANAYAKDHVRNATYNYDGKGANAPPLYTTAGASPEGTSAFDSAYANAYARFRGRLYKGSAQLGVSAGSYRQSREMIVNRSRSVVTQAGEILEDFGKRYTVRGRAAKRLASHYLEIVFGWQPLVTDIHNAAFTVIQLADSVESVRGRSQASYNYTRNTTSPDGKRTMHTNVGGNCMVTLSSLVTISNRNRWLLERAGLLNPASVAWDLVPWSFLVNIIANTGSIVNSITDFAGLTFNNASTTRTFFEGGNSLSRYKDSGTFPFPWSTSSMWSSAWSSDRKIREVGSVPRPSLVLKIPDANWSLAAIASSLMVQKVYAVGNVLRQLDRSRYSQ